MALPQRLMRLVQLWREDNARLIGKAVAMVETNEIDEVETHRAELSSLSGVPESRIQEIVDTARTVFGVTTSDRIPGQHTVSKVLLKRFVDVDQNGRRGVCTYSFETGHLVNPRNPSSIGKLKNFVKIDSKFTEDLWQATEDRLHDALEAVRTRNLFDFPELVSVIKDAIALHYSRSREILEVHELMWETAIAHELKSHQGNPAMGQLFLQKYGLLPPSLSIAQEVMAEDLMADTKKQYESGALFRLRVVDLFEETRALAERAKLQIAIPESGEFVIGDSPGLSVDANDQKVGPKAGVPFAAATTVILPLGPTRIAALAKQNEFVVIPRQLVDTLNVFQIRKSSEHVYFRPGAPVVNLLQSTRPPLNPRKCL